MDAKGTRKIRRHDSNKGEGSSETESPRERSPEGEQGVGPGDGHESTLSWPNKLDENVEPAISDGGPEPASGKKEVYRSSREGGSTCT